MAKARKRGKAWWVALSLTGALLVTGGLWLNSRLSEVGLMGLLSGNNADNRLTVHLEAQSVYHIKKKQRLLDVNVIRIISKQQPEEFLVIDHVSRGMVDQLYGQKPNLTWANLMANQLMKLRQTDIDGEPANVSLDIQDVKTRQVGVIRHHKQELPYWQLEVRFKLSNESESRYYEAGILRNIRPESSTQSPVDTLLIGYAQKEAFQKDLLNDVLTHLRFE